MFQAIDRRFQKLAFSFQTIAHPFHTPPTSIPKRVARKISKRKRMSFIVGAGGQCYNRKGGQGECPACYKFEKYNYQIENIESLGSEIFETGRNL